MAEESKEHFNDVAEESNDGGSFNVAASSGPSLSYRLRTLVRKSQKRIDNEAQTKSRQEKRECAIQRKREKFYDKVQENRANGVAEKSATGDVNDDAKKFLKAYNERSRLEICGVCGTDEEPRNLIALDEFVLNVIRESDLPVFRQHLISKLNKPWQREYVRCIETEFDELGILRHSAFICTWCWKVFKPPSKRKKAATGKFSSAAGSDCPDHEDASVMDVDSDVAQQHVGLDDDCEEGGDEGDSDCDGHFASGDSEHGEPEGGVPENDKVWKLPAKTFLRGLYPAIVPEELESLTLVEISMVSLYNPITRISLGKGSFYHGKGNMFSLVNDITRVAVSLPSMPTLDEFAILRYVNDGVHTEYRYRPNRVRRALDWLKANNHLYQNVTVVYPEDWPSGVTDDTVSVEIESMPVTAEDAEDLQEAAREREEVEEDGVATNSGIFMFRNISV